MIKEQQHFFSDLQGAAVVRLGAGRRPSFCMTDLASSRGKSVFSVSLNSMSIIAFVFFKRSGLGVPNASLVFGSSSPTERM